MHKKKAFIVLFSVFCFLVTASVSAQNISGKVIDKATAEPLIGATVTVKETKEATITDINGSFTIRSNRSTAELEVRYVGYIPRQVNWSQGKTLTIELSEDAQALDEVVVIGYGVQRKSDLTGSVSSIKVDEVITQPTAHVIQALQGRAAGVEIVQNSGAPGSSTSVRIRGMGTINNSDPLYVVDGIPMDDINYLSSDDIESMEILKDASSAAIYGARGANGVVLITTKTGKNSTKACNINFSTYIGFQEAAKTPDIMKKEDYLFYNDYVLNRFYRTQNADGTTVIKPGEQLIMNPVFQEELDKGVDWWDEVSRKGPMYKANLSISGGDKKLNYYVSANFLRSDGIVKESDYARKSFNAKLSAQLHKNVNLSTSLTYVREDKGVVNEGTWGIIKTAINYDPLTPIYSMEENYNWTTPVENLRRTSYEQYSNKFIGQLNLVWTITKGLRFNSIANYTYTNSDSDGFKRYNINPGNVGNIKFDVSRSPSNTSGFGWDNLLTYITNFGDHNLTLLGGQTMETSTNEVLNASGTGYGGYNDNFDALNFTPFNQSVGGYTSGWSAFGFLGRISYDYAGKYLLQVNFRADASSRFAKKNRWGYFPSVSVGWKINSESFLSDAKWISLLKIRAGWGQLGNNRIRNFEYKTLVGNGGHYIYGNGIPTLSSAMSITQYGNQDIRWEKTESYNAGIDFNLFSNRLTTTLDFFVKNTNDMLIGVPIVYSAGYTNTPVQNAGSVRNIGVEFQINYKNNFGKLRYEIGGNISKIKNKVTSLGKYGEPILGGNLGSPNPLGYTNRTVLDAPIACFYGWKTDGVMQPGDFDETGNALIPTFASTKKYNPGDMKFVDINGDGIIDDNDRTFIGSPHPNFYYGFNLNLGYKGFDLSLFFQGVYGNDIFDVTKYFMYSPVAYNGSWSGISSNVATDYFEKVYRPEPDLLVPAYRDYWGANTSGTVPSPRTDATINEINFRASDFYMDKGSYLRLKNIQLSYSLSKNICQKISIKGLKIYASGTNLFTFTKYKGLDPEIGKKIGEEGNNLFLGIDEGTYPQARTYTFGVVLDF